MRKKTFLSLVMAATLTIGATLGTYAWFTSSATSARNNFDAGTLSVSALQKSVVGETFTLNPMQPGDITPWMDVTVKNNGDLNAAVFGRFVVTDYTGLSNELSLYDYKVEYFNDDDNPVERWTTSDFDPYFGTAKNMDYFIKDGVHGFNGSTILKDWATGLNNGGPGDGLGAWDIEGLKPGYSYKLSFRLKYDENATVQNRSCGLAYQVEATQPTLEALNLLEQKDGINADFSAGLSYIKGQLGIN